MKPESNAILLRTVCWTFVVIAPTAGICWAAGINNIGILAVAVPFMLIAEWVFRALNRKRKLCGMPEAQSNLPSPSVPKRTPPPAGSRR